MSMPTTLIFGLLEVRPVCHTVSFLHSPRLLGGGLLTVISEASSSTSDLRLRPPPAKLALLESRTLFSRFLKLSEVQLKGESIVKAPALPQTSSATRLCNSSAVGHEPKPQTRHFAHIWQSHKERGKETERRRKNAREREGETLTHTHTHYTHSTNWQCNSCLHLSVTITSLYSLYTPLTATENRNFTCNTFF